MNVEGKERVNLEQLEKSELIDRLYVTEKILNSLFKRNKELEKSVEEGGVQPISTVKECEKCP
jgi:hypothetical protein